jgi:hypothetical protein
VEDDTDLGAPYRRILPGDGLEPVVAAVMAMPEHAHLVEHDVAIDYLIRRAPKMKAGRQVLGTAYQPSVQGELRSMFEWMLTLLLGRFPEFLIVLDEGFWETASPREREILVFHELSHCVQDVDKYGAPRFDKATGAAVFCLAGHDVEEFIAVAARYGAWTDEIKRFTDAVNSA